MPDDNLIEGNTISGNEMHGILIDAASAPTELVITGNDIIDNTDDGISIAEWDASNAIHFNTISGNTDYGVQNDTDEDVDATHNWWGTTVASEIAGMINDTGSGDTDHEPWLLASVSAGEFTTGVTSLDAQVTVGVKVLGAASADQIICAARYTENPMATPEFTPLEDGFFDVYVKEAGTVTEIGIKFYDAALTSDSVVYVWDAFEEVWAECSDQDYNATYGCIWVKVRQAGIDVPTVPTISDLAGTPFAISTEEAPPSTIQLYEGATPIQYTGATTPLPDALTNISEITEIVWQRDPSTGGEWWFYFVEWGTGEITQLENGRVYIVVVSEDCIWELAQ